MNKNGVVGSGEPGLKDGGYANCQFNFPTGMDYCPDTKQLFVCDSFNHCIRVVDMQSCQVKTLVGTGHKGTSIKGGKLGSQQDIAMPSDVVFCKQENKLFIAMAKLHQIWSYDFTVRMLLLPPMTQTVMHC